MAERTQTYDKAGALTVQYRVLHALILREMQVRFGRKHMGYMWAFVEPLSFVVLLVGIRFVWGGGGSAVDAMPIAPFVSTGLLTYLTFRMTMELTMQATRGNRPLLMHPQITPLDFMVARAALQLPTMIAVFLFIYALMLLLGYTEAMYNPLGVLSVLVLAVLLGLGCGMVLASAVEVFPLVGKLIPILLRPLFFMSGLFFVAAELPADLRDWLLWNPVFQLVEICRTAYFVSFDSPYFSIRYISTWIMISLFLGFLFERSVRPRIGTT